MIGVLSTVVPVMFMLMVGAICRRFNIFTREGINALKSVVVNITLPAVLINAYATMAYDGNSILLVLLVYGACALGWLLGIVLKKMFFKKSGKFIPYLTTGFEAGMLGYALYTMLYGAENIVEFARLDLGQGLFVFTMYKMLLAMEVGEKKPIKEIFREMFSSPIMIAIIVGVLLGATGLFSASFFAGGAVIITAITDFVSAPTAAIILITIGYDLVLDQVPWAATCKAIVARLAVLVVVWVICRYILIGMDLPEEINAMTVMFILPPPFILPVFADDSDQQVFISSALTVSTIVTIIGFVILAFV